MRTELTIIDLINQTLYRLICYMTHFVTDSKVV